MEKKTTIKVFEGFAGYGGASFAMKRLNKQYTNLEFETIGFSEINQSAIDLFNANHKQKGGKKLIKNWGDITKIDENDPSLQFDMFAGGFPCQPFSTAGYMLGEADPRGTLFNDIVRLCNAKKPKYIFLENVVGLSRGRFIPTFEKIKLLLAGIGYDVKTVILNSKDYGVPQNRQRLWFFGIHKDFATLPEDFILEPPKIELTTFIEDYLDKEPAEELYRSAKQIAHIKEIHKKADDYFDVKERLCYDYYNRRIRTDRVCMTLTPPSHNIVRIVEPRKDGQDRFRKLSIDEHFRLMGFRINDSEREIIYPNNLSYIQLGERAGNGWEINVVTVLLKHIFDQLQSHGIC